jgi:hypothetical protein
MSNTPTDFELYKDCIKIMKLDYSFTLYSKNVTKLAEHTQFPYSPPKCPPFPNAKSERTLIV